VSSREGAPTDVGRVNRSSLTPALVFAALLFLGLGLRTAALLNERNLWFDESRLALNLVERTPAQLLEPLDRNQAAPIGFLLLTKAAIQHVGASAVGFRLVSYLGSLLGLFAFLWLARRLFSETTAFLAVALFAVAPGLISYAAECKQYALDAACTVALFSVAVKLLEGRGGVRAWMGLALAGAIAVWTSHSAVFVLGGIGAVLLAESVRNRDRARFLGAAATVGCWLASFVASFLLFNVHSAGNPHLRAYWGEHFLPMPPRSPGDLLWLPEHYFTLFDNPAGLDGTEVRAGGIAAVLFLVGFWEMWKQRRPLALAIALTALLALGASALQRYPFAARLLLFLVPLVILGVARGAGLLFTALRPTQPFAAFTFLTVLIAAPCLESFERIGRPARLEQLEPVIARVRTQFESGDRLYVYYGAAPAFTFYTRENPFPPGAVLIETEAYTERAAYRSQLAALRGARRVWLLFSHAYEDDAAIITVYAEELGRCELVVTAPGAAAYLLEFD